MKIIGINAFHGDASAAALVDGRLVAAVEEERFTRVKHQAGFPAEALRWVASEAGLAPDEPFVLAVPRKPNARLLNKIFYAFKAPGLALRRLKAQSRFATIEKEVAEALGGPVTRIEVRRVEHHTAHLASSFFCSPFETAALLSVDGLGDFASAQWGVGRGPRIETRGSVSFPHSLGFYYTALTQYLGFTTYGDEYKVMGLASYGEPTYLNEFREILRDAGDGMGFSLDLTYFRHQDGSVRMTWEEGAPTVDRLYSDHLVDRLGPAREPGESIEERHENLAATLQAHLEEVLLGRLRHLHEETGESAVCLAGGVAYNCVVNGKVRRETGFDELYVPPAAGDAGLAVGAALHVWHQEEGHPRDFVMEHAFWGPGYDAEDEREALEARSIMTEGTTDLDDGPGLETRRIDDDERMAEAVADRLEAGDICGWYRGRLEWGPRALGNRSILADPRDASVRDEINAKIKLREAFRPFAPSVLEEAAGEYFEQSHPSPFMNLAYRVRPEKRDVIPATTHVDGTGRLQTVSPSENPLYHQVIEAFGERTGVPVVLNTSFNENEPIVCTPEEALDCFLRTRMDTLSMGPYFIRRVTGPNGDGS